MEKVNDINKNMMQLLAMVLEILKPTLHLHLDSNQVQCIP